MLYITATPIGNLDDITLRALQVLQACSIIIAENPLYTKRLLNHFGTEGKKLVQFAEHNEQSQLPKLLSLLKDGDAVLVSDAGTPGISDPGFRLVREAINNEIKVTPLPGANAAIASLSSSGLPTDKFWFVGFLPKTEIKLKKLLEQGETIDSTMVAYESPQRLLKTLVMIKKFSPNAKLVITRELTKLHEEFIRGDATHILEDLTKRTSIKGEITISISFK